MGVLEPAGGTAKNSDYSVKIKLLTIHGINCYVLRNKLSSDELLCLKVRCQTFAFCRASHFLETESEIYRSNYSVSLADIK